MTFPTVSKVEPFGEPSVQGCPDRLNDTFRFGYRIPDTNTVLASVEVPLSVVQQSIPQELSVKLSQNGAVIASLDLEGGAGCNGIMEVSLVQLVEELIEPHHLSMEEVKPSDLEVLLLKLESSARLVRAAMSSLKSSTELPFG
jgi:hypothetical protein